MTSSLKKTYRQQRQLGLDLRQSWIAARALFATRVQEQRFLSQARESQFQDAFSVGPRYYTFGDANNPGGTARGHYFHQDLHVAREVFRRNPQRHIDVGSSVEGLVAHLASFREVEVVDVRPTISTVSGIVFHQLDITSRGEDWETIGMADSVSCLHALEHFGLGRYGDALDFDGWFKGILGLERLVEPGGMLYLSVPTGRRQRVEFNAHRVFSLPFLLEILRQRFRVCDVSFVDDEGDLHVSVDLNSPAAQRSFDADYGCSIWFLQAPNPLVVEGG